MDYCSDTRTILFPFANPKTFSLFLFIHLFVALLWILPLLHCLVILQMANIRRGYSTSSVKIKPTESYDNSWHSHTWMERRTLVWQAEKVWGNSCQWQLTGYISLIFLWFCNLYHQYIGIYTAIWKVYQKLIIPRSYEGCSKIFETTQRFPFLSWNQHYPMDIDSVWQYHKHVDFRLHGITYPGTRCSMYNSL